MWTGRRGNGALFCFERAGSGSDFALPKRHGHRCLSALVGFSPGHDEVGWTGEGHGGFCLGLFFPRLLPFTSSNFISPALRPSVLLPSLRTVYSS